jgi:fructokinase
MAARLGNHAAILSRIGRDDLGRKAIEALQVLPADTEFLQIDAAHETGRVTVTFRNEQPEYTIHQSAAWDFLSLSNDWIALAERADAVCFGSLAQRSPQSRQTIQELVAETRAECIRVFDVNLRPPFYTGEAVEESLELATILKMNDAEVPILQSLLGLPTETGILQDAQRLLSEFPGLHLVAITRGGSGSLLVTRDGWHDHAGIAIEVADTIGAGDAFTAAMTDALLRGASLAAVNEAGNRWGAWVASQQGGMPVLTDEIKRELVARTSAFD